MLLIADVLTKAAIAGAVNGTDKAVIDDAMEICAEATECGCGLNVPGGHSRRLFRAGANGGRGAQWPLLPTHPAFQGKNWLFSSRQYEFQYPWRTNCLHTK